MKRVRYLVLGTALVALFVGLGLWQPATKEAKARDDRPSAPRFTVDWTWPKALPNFWLVGQVAGIAVDKHDRIWIIQRPRTLTDDEAGRESGRSDCCNRAPSVMEFDREGNLHRRWGGPNDPGFLATKCTPAMGCEWPNNEHGIFVDHNDYVWIAGNGGGDHQVLKFTRDGTFVLQIGKAGLTGGSNATTGSPNGTPLLGNPADVEVDPANNEAYIADGYMNHRVLVVDGRTGLYKRHWGAYGSVPTDAPNGTYTPGQKWPQFRNPVHCARVARDGLVYVCDRVNDRIQVFERSGRFVEEIFVEPDTLGNGSTWDIDLSPDKRQEFLYNPDGENNYVWILDRLPLRILDRFGRNGRNAGQFHWVHNLAVDSKGNIYTAEVDTGKRAQKFTPGGSGKGDDNGNGKHDDDDN
jgi:hypothetical protein